VDNNDLSLRPGMTATAEITTLTRENVLLVPNAALRFSPPAADTATKKRGGSVLDALLPRPPRLSPRPRAPAQAKEGSRQLWVLRDGQAVPVEVQTGASNGRVTEIVGGQLRAGMNVITEALGSQP
jgi:HlyD family secretion protein